MTVHNPGPTCRIGIDVGGTFTDFVLIDRRTREMTRFKEPSVPSDPSLSIERGLPKLLEKAGRQPADVELVVHGTTLLVNAIIQRRGVDVALVVSKGNRGILEIGRGNLAHTQDFTLRKEEPLVKRDLVLEVDTRVSATGELLDSATDDDIAALTQRIRDAGIGSVAVQLLHSYRYPDAEIALVGKLQTALPQVSFTSSAHIWPELGEYERSLIALLNAYVQPIMIDYLGKLTVRLERIGVQAPLYITASNGGTITVDTAMDRPIDTILSGPASGVVAASRIAAGVGIGDFVTVDIGGTSADVAVVQSAEPSFTTMSRVGDFSLILPVLEVSAIGAGGGSIVWVDPQGVLKIGPDSAGADPGPACYGRGGTNATITDCYLAAGYIDPDNFLGGRMKLDRAASLAALETVAAKLGMSGEDGARRVAAAALDIATSLMATEIQKCLARRGEDAGDYALMAFGGAGPTHGNLLAAETGMKRYIVPAGSSTFCALGAILSDVKRDYVRSDYLSLADAKSCDVLAALFRELEANAAGWISKEGALLGTPEFAATLEMRYKGQAFDLVIALPEAVRATPTAEAISELFHREHEKLYGFRDALSPIEIVTERLRVIGRIAGVALPASNSAGTPEPIGSRRVFHDGAFLDVPVFDRAMVGRDTEIAGPAIIEQDDGTAWVLPGWSVTGDDIGNLVIERDAR